MGAAQAARKLRRLQVPPALQLPAPLLLLLLWEVPHQLLETRCQDSLQELHIQVVSQEQVSQFPDPDGRIQEAILLSVGTVTHTLYISLYRSNKSPAGNTLKK